MTSETVHTFTRTLRLAERTHELEPLVSLFSEDACLSNLATAFPLRGKAGTYRFWRDYLSSFDSVETRFKRIVEKPKDELSGESESVAVLEWESAGILKSGKPFRFAGATILELQNERILALKSYYDSAVFV